jgi:hypothetical protein
VAVIDHRAKRSDEDSFADPWAEHGVCRDCGGKIILQRATPDKFGNQKMIWRHVAVRRSS